MADPFGFGIPEDFGVAIGEPPRPKEDYPKARAPGLGPKAEERFIEWVEDWLLSLIPAHTEKIAQWREEEKAYRAEPGPPKEIPFVGACNDVVPLIASGVDPVFARLDTGIFKADPVFRVKPLAQRVKRHAEALERFINAYQKHQLRLREVSAPRLLELAKHGTCVFKTVFDVERYRIRGYERGTWKVVDREITRYKGPRVFGIGLNNFIFPPTYQRLQDCPIVIERQVFLPDQLKIAQASGKLANVEKVLEHVGMNSDFPDDLLDERQESSKHRDPWRHRRLIEVYEIWADFDVNDDGLPESVVATYHRPTRTLLQFRYNWYFHQRKPYTVIPYGIANDSLYGIGLAEMIRPFQEVVTKITRGAVDNAYLANINIFVGRKDAGVEQPLKVYPGRYLALDDPDSFRAMNLGVVYNSTLQERQNLIGLAEKRTGVSDYLVGRESPIMGSRATATSTLALIQEGTKRVESVMENIRAGYSEIIQNCLWIWVQYGTGGIEDRMFDPEVSESIRQFFAEVDETSIEGAMAVELTATDASTNRVTQQQLQLGLIQAVMSFLDRTVQLGQLALQAQQQNPQAVELFTGVLDAARAAYRDLLGKYDVPNPEEYLPDIDRVFGPRGEANQPGGTPGEPAMERILELAGLVPGAGGAGAAGGPGGMAVPPTPGAGAGPPEGEGLPEGFGF